MMLKAYNGFDNSSETYRLVFFTNQVIAYDDVNELVTLENLVNPTPSYQIDFTSAEITNLLVRQLLPSDYQVYLKKIPTKQYYTGLQQL